MKRIDEDEQNTLRFFYDGRLCALGQASYSRDRNGHCVLEVPLRVRKAANDDDQSQKNNIKSTGYPGSHKQVVGCPYVQHCLEVMTFDRESSPRYRAST